LLAFAYYFQTVTKSFLLLLLCRVISMVVGLGLPALTYVLLVTQEAEMSWYSRPWMLFPLYGAPVLAGTLATMRFLLR
jgi:hypothetical protein